MKNEQFVPAKKARTAVHLSRVPAAPRRMCLCWIASAHQRQSWCHTPHHASRTRQTTAARQHQTSATIATTWHFWHRQTTQLTVPDTKCTV